MNRLLLNWDVINGNEIFIRTDPYVQGIENVSQYCLSKLLK